MTLVRMKILKIVFVLKFAILATYLLFAHGHLQVEEKPVIAKEAEKAEAKSAEPAKKEEPIRQGYLEGLLELPKLDIEQNKKDEVGRYLSLIERAKQQAEDRLKLLKERGTQLEELERTIDGKLKSLDEERQFFAHTIQQEKEIQKERLDTLVDLYSKMEPKKAAAVFETLDKDMVVALFKKMRGKDVTKILELISPDKSVKITEYFGRIGSAKEYNLLKEMNDSLRMAFNDCKGLPKHP